MFSVCICARYQASPKIIKRILRYLNGTSQHGLWYPNGGACSLVGFCDSNFVGCKSDRKSTSVTCHLFGFFLVSWHSMKQHSVSLSNVEAVYIAASSYYTQVLWIKKQFIDYYLNLKCILIKCDSTSVISLAKNSILHSRTKHIEIWHHFLRDHVEKGDVGFEYVDTKN